MGVSGVGKTSLGRKLAEQLGWTFLDADDFHSAEAVEKMAGGTPLTDADRVPWLRRLHNVLTEFSTRGESVVLACSALKASGRRILVDGVPDVRFVLLEGDPTVIRDRMLERRHFMPSRLLASQLADLEPPADALVVPLDLPPQRQVAIVRGALKLE